MMLLNVVVCDSPLYVHVFKVQFHTPNLAAHVQIHAESYGSHMISTLVSMTISTNT